MTMLENKGGVGRISSQDASTSLDGPDIVQEPKTRQELSRKSEGPAFPVRRAKAKVTFGAIVAAVGDVDELRSLVMARFAAKGGDRDR